MANGNYQYQSDMAMTPMKAEYQMERRQSCILVADMAGYSRWMAFDEDALIRRLQWVRANIIYPTLSEYGGLIWGQYCRDNGTGNEEVASLFWYV